MASIKDSRIAVRMTAADEQVIRAAADAQGRTVTDFTVQAALAAAQNVLADQVLLVLSADAWDEFNAILDRPPADNPALRKLLASPSVFDD